MQLLELSDAERGFFDAHARAEPDFAGHFTARLAATLKARLRAAVVVEATQVDTPHDAGAVPVWRPDTGLASIWLTYRLGGKRVVGTTHFIPGSLIAMLDHLLAECWVECGPAHEPPHRAWAWRLTVDGRPAQLALFGTERPRDMARWVQGVLQRG